MTKHLVRGLNKAGTRMIRVELDAPNSTEAVRLVRLANPDAGNLACVRTPQTFRVLEQLAQHTQPGDLSP